MARLPDPDLEDRILNAARQLWKKGAGKALTMRAVARAAQTNTPAVYRRFPHRDDILRALLHQTRQDVMLQLEAASTVEEACERYLDYALSHPHEYELYYLHEYELLFANRPASGLKLNQFVTEHRPAVELMKTKFAKQLGGSPGDHMGITLTIWTMLHGMATLMIRKTISPGHAVEAREAFRASLEALMRDSRRSARRK